MDLSHLPILVPLPLLLLASAACSAGETALFSLGHADRVRLAREHPLAAGEVARLLAHPRALLVTLLLLNTTVNLMFFVVSSVAVRRVDGIWAVALSVACVFGMIVLGELLPKLLARRLRVAFSAALGPVVGAAFRLVSPVRAVFEHGVVAPLTRLIAPVETGAQDLTVEELAEVLEVSASEGEIDRGEQRLLADVVGLGSLRIRDVMTPRMDVRWLKDSATSAAVIERVRATGRTLQPVCRGTPDAGVIGMLDAKAYLSDSARGREARLAEHLSPVLFMPERARLDRLLEEFRRARTHAAVCVDEYGTVVGFVHIEDVLAVLVASDEPDAGSAGSEVRRTGPQSWSVPGRLPIKDLRDLARGAAGGAGVSTVAGLIMVLLGRLPRAGDSVRFGNLRLSVESLGGAGGRVIERVTISIEGARP